MGWAGLGAQGWVGRVGWGWVGLGGVGLGWVGLDGVVWCGLVWYDMVCGVGWGGGVRWNRGLEVWVGLECGRWVGWGWGGSEHGEHSKRAQQRRGHLHALVPFRVAHAPHVTRLWSVVSVLPHRSASIPGG